MTSFSALLASPNPDLPPALVASALVEHWGLEDVRLQALGSTQDQNFRVDAAQGRFVLKVANRASSRADLELQGAAMRHLAGAGTGIEVPLPVPDRTGADVVELDGHRARLATWVRGTPLADHHGVDRRALVVLGDVAARCAEGLAGFAHPHLDRELQWDPRHAGRLAAELLPTLGPADRRAATASAALAPLDALPGAALPVQAVHLDVTDYNVVGHADRRGAFCAEGVIDVGDVVRTWRVAEVAHAAMAAVFHALRDPLDGVLEVVRAFHHRVPLDEAEAAALWPILLARAAVCALSSTHQAALAGESPHLVRLMAEDWSALEAVTAIPSDFAEAAIRAACGSAPLAQAGAIAEALGRAEAAPVLRDAGPLVPVDLSVTSERFSARGWERPETLAQALVVDGVAAGRWGEVRLHHAGPPSDHAPATLHLGVDLFAPVGTPVSTPLAGRVERVAGHEVLLEVTPGGVRLQLRLAGVRAAVGPGTTLAAGDHVGEIAHADGMLPSHVHVQLCAGSMREGVAPCRDRAALLALCPDPSPLLGVDLRAPAGADRDEAARQRHVTVAEPQRLYYQRPPVFVRGAGHLLYDTDGRPYIDSVNNVQLVGHSHPRVAAAAARALHLFGANSRFLHPDMARYADRLAGMLPDELSSVFLVNSGSEAVELALRLARAVTGRDEVIAIDGAYHGWTAGAFGVSSYPEDRPPGWRPQDLRGVRLVAQPDPLRGIHGGDAHAYVADVARACAAQAPAAFISEPLLGNQGGIEPPAGFLAGAYAAVRRAGGLCIADEVQVGLGRTGDHLWAFEHEGVVPDIVCTAKGLGNGFPLGAVVCRPEIAAALGDVSFFSSTAGSPLSCAVGLAVLDVLQEERLQENARVVGGRLREGLEALAIEHRWIGAILGRGLFLGVDLVVNGDTGAPATPEADAVCEAALARGLVIRPTGDRGNVLKVKPPLTIDAAGSDHLLHVLDAVVGELPEPPAPRPDV